MPGSFTISNAGEASPAGTSPVLYDRYVPSPREIRPLAPSGRHTERQRCLRSALGYLVIRSTVLNIYVGNLSFDTRDDDLQSAFGQYGEVSEARVITDRMTNRSRGFGFVEMPDRNAAQSAIDALNGREFQGRTLTVNEARPREDRGPRGGGGGGGRGGFRR